MVDFAFLDSGTGGLPYLLHLKELCPSAACVYIADTKNFPYGTKSRDEIVSSAVEVSGEIAREFNPRAIVVACNTISVTALNELRENFPSIQIIGTVPAIKLAGSVSKNRRIGLLATKATVQSEYIQNLKADFASDCELVLREDTELIDFVEKKSFTASDDEIQKACLPAADFFKKEGCDTVILGCTHFLNISASIQKAFGDAIKVVDSRDGVARRAISVCKVEEKGYNPKTKLYITGKKDSPEYKVIIEKYGLELCK